MKTRSLKSQQNMINATPTRGNRSPDTMSSRRRSDDSPEGVPSPRHHRLGSPGKVSPVRPRYKSPEKMSPPKRKKYSPEKALSVRRGDSPPKKTSPALRRSHSPLKKSPGKTGLPRYDSSDNDVLEDFQTAQWECDVPQKTGKLTKTKRTKLTKDPDQTNVDDRHSEVCSTM